MNAHLPMTPYLQQKTLFLPTLSGKPAPNLGLVVVVPAFREPFLLRSLLALKACQPPEQSVEVIVVVNDSERDGEEVRALNRQVYLQARSWAEKNSTPRMKFFVEYFDGLPAKAAGVGLARKIGMDLACLRLETVGRSEGLILSFDADTRCDPDYLQAVEAHFRRFPDTQAASIYFEHPLQGAEFEPEVYRAIAHYELHLRYLVEAQRWAGFPFATQTIGSAMAVRCDAYQRQGGMNRRQAGEDFYFLHKFTPLGHFYEINTTRVLPSPRPSDRVPFGTGKAVHSWLRTEHPVSYHPRSFEMLRPLFAALPSLFEGEEERLAANWPPLLLEFLETRHWRRHLEEMRRHAASLRTFAGRFFRWFDAFQVIRWLHFARERCYPEVPVVEGAAWLLEQLGEGAPARAAVPLLERYRRRARQRPTEPLGFHTCA